MILKGSQSVFLPVSAHSQDAQPLCVLQNLYSAGVGKWLSERFQRDKRCCVYAWVSPDMNLVLFQQDLPLRQSRQCQSSIRTCMKIQRENLLLLIDGTVQPSQTVIMAEACIN